MNKEAWISKLETAIISNNGSQHYAEKCCNYAKRLLDNNLPVIFDIEHLALLLGTDTDFLKKIISKKSYYYSTMQIPKKSGGKRVLDIPCVELKYIQRWILDSILSHMRVSEHATGFVQAKSILDNAKIHCCKECVINIDIKDFFSSIKFGKVFAVFRYYGYSKSVASILSKLCTFNSRLPQGSPASPALSNIVCLKLDKRLSGLAKKYEADYSRYADDISFSGNSRIKKIIELSEKILVEEGFYLNDYKTRIQYPYQQQEVTGLIVNNETVRVNKKYKRSLSQEIYYCQKYGVEDHLSRINCDKNFYKEHLYGKAYFINMVEPDKGKKLLEELEKIEWGY